MLTGLSEGAKRDGRNCDSVVCIIYVHSTEPYNKEHTKRITLPNVSCRRSSARNSLLNFGRALVHANFRH